MEDATRRTQHKPRRWGTVIKRKDDDGNIIAYVARYVNPLDKSKKIGKQFKPEYEAQAYAWLDEEHYLVILHEKGIQQWVPPSERGKKQGNDSLMTFEEWTRTYFKKYKEKHGRMRGRTMRRTKLAVGRLMPYFRTMTLNEITEEEVSKWRRTAKKEIPSPDGYEKASFMLKRLMQAAVREGLKAENPCKYTIPPYKPKKEDIRPLDKKEVGLIADAFPEYTRLAVWLSVLVGGLRIGEVCGLQLRDLDLDNGLLYVRHSVDRGEDDCGPYELCPTKTRKSERVLPIPSALIPMIRNTSNSSAQRKTRNRCCSCLLREEYCHRQRSRRNSGWPGKNRQKRRILPYLASHARDPFHDQRRHTPGNNERTRTPRHPGRSRLLPACGAGTPTRSVGTAGIRLPAHGRRRDDGKNHRRDQQENQTTARTARGTRKPSRKDDDPNRTSRLNPDAFSDATVPKRLSTSKNPS